jgi:peroxiredoxin
MFRNLAPAPDFRLLDETGHPRSLEELRGGQSLVIVFFRGAFCATTRRDLLAYADIQQRLQWLGADLVAISVDAPPELHRLRERLELPFRLLSDLDFAVSRAYGVYESDERDVGPQPHGEPAVYVLDKAGRIVHWQLQSGPKGHAHADEIVLILMHMARNDGRYW